MNAVECNKCGYSFVLEDANFGLLNNGDLAVQYFICPNCRKKYHFFTSDSQMRDLIERRKSVQMKIRAAFAKNFREGTIQKYERELDQIKRQQQKLMPGLKAAGEKVLRQTENTTGGMHSADAARIE